MFQQYLISARPISAIRNMYSINIYTPYPVLVYCCGNAFKIFMQQVHVWATSGGKGTKLDVIPVYRTKLKDLFITISNALEMMMQLLTSLYE